MSKIPTSEQPFLQNATPQQIVQATACNHRELFCMNAKVADGVIHQTAGFIWTHAGSRHDAMIAFPELSAQNAGSILDEIMLYYQQHPTRGAGCWSLDPVQPADLGVKLLARGFQPGWRPQWMAKDLNIITDHLIPDGVEIRADSHTHIHTIYGLPYSGLNDGGVNQPILNAFPENTQRFLAFLNGKIVAQAAVLLAEGVAGIYNVGVIPSARNNGIGKAIVLAACNFAHAAGYNYAVLNATGRRMYQQAGFSWMGDGYTWWLKTPGNIPTPERVAQAEAIGTGNIKALSDKDLLLPLTNGMTLMQLAVHYRQPASAEWLIQHGVPYTVMDAWDLGWKDRAAKLLQDDPLLVNRQYGELSATILHMAVERNDIELARLALAAKPDLSVRDYRYNATALDWSGHLQRPAIAELIKENGG